MTAQPPSDTDESRKTTCYRCACRCGIDVHLRAGKLRTIEGNQDHPVNRGVICAKGAAGIQQVTAPARLRAPLKRVGPRGARIVSVNPVRTGCNAVADDWLGLTPGTDGLLILALVHELLVAGRIDLDDLARFTDAPCLLIPGEGPESGLYLRDDTGRALVIDRCSEALAPFDGDGVEPDLRGPWPGHRHDRMIGRPVGFHAMRGIAAHANGFQTARALHLLQMLLGAIETPGGLRFKPPYPKPLSAHPVPHFVAEPGKPLDGPHLGFPRSPAEVARWLTDRDVSRLQACFRRRFCWRARLSSRRGRARRRRRKRNLLSERPERPQMISAKEAA
ncbi:molybdopterin-dependent oxidoreductase iron-sulfur protein [Rhodobacter capsulatus]|nr:hypothetical protein AP071_07615 [Rhodobacter capsulatus]KQB12676.1 hypothetical protein AP073_06110 [Rhodobacter capsulatus]PZX23237.1 molybdopterin-dependent oxidoreductase iron-sulfur protein [Rhodobacter capsulatus]